MRRQYVSKASLAVLPAVFSLLTGCAGGGHDPAEKYILVASHVKIAYWQAAAQGLAHAAAEMKVKSEVQGPDDHDPQGEHDAFRRAMAENPSGILVSASDAALLTPDINAAMEKNIPVITIDSDAPDSKRLFFVGTDNYTAGLIGGRMTAKLLGGKGTVVVFTMAQGNLKNRMQGYQAAFADHTEVLISQTVDMNGNSDVAFDNAKKIIESKSKTDAFVCLEALSCSAVADVVNRANMAGKITIVAMDTDPLTIDWIKKGVISATIAQKPYTMAYYGAKLLADLHLHPPTPLTGDFSKNILSPIPTFVDTGTFVIDKSNVATFNQPVGAGQ